MSAFTLAPARPDQAGLILGLLQQLAAFENLPFTQSEEKIGQDFFGPRPVITCELGFEEDAPVGLVSYYWTYASFRGARCLFVEDLFVAPAHRGKGYGGAMLKRLAAIGLAEGAARLEWDVLKWNTQAICFYRSIGAVQYEGWDNYWLERDAMKALGGT